MSSFPEVPAAVQDERYLHLAGPMRDRFQIGYSEALDYHGPGHEGNVVTRAMRYRNHAAAAGVEEVSSAFRTIMGASGHDFGYEYYFLGGQDKFFKSPEEFSMFWTGKLLDEQGVDQFTIDQILDDQLGTKAGVRCVTPGQFILCAADMYPTMLKDRTQMRLDTAALRVEDVYLRNRDLGDMGFTILAVGLLATYHQVNLNNPEMLRQFPDIARRRRQMGINIAALFRDSAQKFGEDALRSVAKLPELFARSVLDLVGISLKTPVAESLERVKGN